MSTAKEDADELRALGRALLVVANQVEHAGARDAFDIIEQLHGDLRRVSGRIAIRAETEPARVLHS